MVDYEKIVPHVLKEDAFKNELKRFLVSVECVNGHLDDVVYADIYGVPTIGIGYALVVKNTNKQWVIRDNNESQFASINKTVSEADIDILQQIVNALNNGNITKAKDLANSDFSFEPSTDDQIKNLLVDVALTEYSGYLKSRIGSTLKKAYEGSGLHST